MMSEYDGHLYVQKASRVQGPYSCSTIRRYLLLGRIGTDARVSIDGRMWEPITQVPELIPEQMLNLQSAEGWESFLLAREQVDPREVSVLEHDQPERRAQDDEDVLVSLRKSWSKMDLATTDPIQRKANKLPVSLLGLTLCVLIALLVFHVVTDLV